MDQDSDDEALEGIPLGEHVMLPTPPLRASSAQSYFRGGVQPSSGLGHIDFTSFSLHRPRPCRDLFGDGIIAMSRLDENPDSGKPSPVASKESVFSVATRGGPPSPEQIREAKRQKGARSATLDDLSGVLDKRGREGSPPSSFVRLPCSSDLSIRGDGRKCLLPPMLQGASHPDIRSIEPKTLQKLLQGELGQELDGFLVIDCRFPFEYEGGHIRGAVNIWTLPMLENLLFTEKREQLFHCRRFALIFHCEFSSHRAPRAVKHIRNLDRRIHLSTYPKLFFPEMYLLEGGYKNFFGQCSDFCEPSCYIEMLDERYTEKLNEAHRIVRQSRKNKSEFQNPLIQELTALVDQETLF
eukprot:m.272595 g.272595  ORF g.272595 m.272595 type:complete len:354 (+) comp16275_c1_seq19:102-1163(+)